MSVESHLTFNFESEKQIEAAKQYDGRLTGTGQGTSIQDLDRYNMRYKGLQLEFWNCFWNGDFVYHSKELSIFVAKKVPDIPFSVSGNFMDGVCSEGNIDAYLSYDGNGVLNTYYTYGYEGVINEEYDECDEYEEYEDETSSLRIEEEKIIISEEQIKRSLEIWTTEELKDGTLAITGYNGEETELIIPAELDRKKVSVIKGTTISPDVKGLNKQQYTNREKITRIEVPLTITCVESDIYHHKNLKEVIIPARLVTLNDLAWYGLHIEFTLKKVFAGMTAFASLVSVGSKLTFGNIWINNAEEDEKNILTEQKIEWEILDINKKRALVISNELPFEFEYSLRGEKIWKTSKLRKWLNGNFINYIFNNYEQERIKQSIIVNEEGNTRDKIFILSKEEIEKYYPDEKVRKEKVGYSITRTVNKSNQTVVIVNEDGVLDDYEYNGMALGLHIAMWIKLY